MLHVTTADWEICCMWYSFRDPGWEKPLSLFPGYWARAKQNGEPNAGARDFCSDMTHVTSAHILLSMTSHMAASTFKEPGKYHPIEHRRHAALIPRFCMATDPSPHAPGKAQEQIPWLDLIQVQSSSRTNTLTLPKLHHEAPLKYRD